MFKGFVDEVTDLNGATYRLGEDHVVAIQLHYEDELWGHTFAVYRHEREVVDPFEQMIYVRVDPTQIKEPQ